jgi:hypothetical protein
MKMWIPISQPPWSRWGANPPRHPAPRIGRVGVWACGRWAGIAQRKPVHSNVQLWEWCERGRR